MGTFLLILFVIVFFSCLVNYPVWTLSIVGIIALYGLIKYLVNKGKEKERNATKTQPNAAASRQTVNSTSANTPAPSKKADNTDSDDGKLRRLLNSFSVPDPPSSSITPDPLQTEMESYRCLEVSRTIIRTAELRKKDEERLRLIKNRIDGILSCPGCSSKRSGIKYITDHERELNELKKEYFSVCNKRIGTKVKLITANSGAFSELSSALKTISGSKKAVGSSNVSFDDFINFDVSLPGDLFVSDSDSIRLDLGKYKFYLLPDSILVYNKNDEYVAALEPIALIIGCSEKKKSVTMSNRNYSGWKHSDTLIGADSKLLSQGGVRTTWLHTKRDGGPDKRYSYNPSFQSRTDTYAYSEVVVRIGNQAVIYSVSKSGISEIIAQKTKAYCSIVHKASSVPSLLSLLENTAKKKEEAGALISEYESGRKELICKEVRP